MTNQVNTLTNQDVMLDLYKIHAYIPNDAAGNPLTPFGNFCEGYESATKASQSEINSLKERVEELQASNNQLKVALNYLDEAFDSEVWNCERCGHAEETKTMDSAIYLKEFLATLSTPAQSLAEREDD